MKTPKYLRAATRRRRGHKVREQAGENVGAWCVWLKEGKHGAEDLSGCTHHRFLCQMEKIPQRQRSSPSLRLLRGGRGRRSRPAGQNVTFFLRVSLSHYRIGAFSPSLLWVQLDQVNQENRTCPETAEPTFTTIREKKPQGG